ncbi:MAG TPA: DUF58 domain-containing protein [bacterium]|nr:DUF58 domain-containing protein [bacterium]
MRRDPPSAGPSPPGGDAGLLDPAFLQRLEALSLVSRRRVRGRQRGERRSLVRGRGIEFDDYRAYEPGDDYRYIDWNIASRLDRFFVKLFSEEEDLDVHLLVDTSRSMAAGTPSKLLLAKRLAAAIGYVGLVNLDRVEIGVFSSGPGPRLSRLRGRGRAFDLLRFLDGIRPEGATDLGLALRRTIEGSARRGLLVLISDMLDPLGYEEGLLRARHQRLQTFVIHVLAEEELAPPLGGELRLVDVETGRAVEVTVDADALRAYAAARDAYLEGLQRFCFRHGIEYLRTASTVPADALVLRYLRQAGLVR